MIILETRFTRLIILYRCLHTFSTKCFVLKIDNQCLLPYLPLTTCICNIPIYGLLSRSHALWYLLKDNKTLSDYYSLQYKRSIKWSINLLKLIVIFHFNVTLLLKINTIMIEWENHTIMLGFFSLFSFFFNYSNLNSV